MDSDTERRLNGAEECYKESDKPEELFLISISQGCKGKTGVWGCRRTNVAQHTKEETQESESLTPHSSFPLEALPDS